MKSLYLLGALLLAQTVPTPPASPAPVTPAASPTAAATEGPNVLPNGDFEQADPANPNKPAHWDSVDGTAVAWVDSKDPGHGKAIRMETDLSEQAAVDAYAKAGETQWVFPNPASTPIGESYGESLYSEGFPCEPDKAYHISFDYKCEKGTGSKVWMRGYAMVDGKLKRVYEGYVDCGGNADWKTYTGVFDPTKHTPNVTVLKIMLYGLYPDGVAWFDNVKLTTSDEADDDN
jgi:hypothetical protein